MSIPGSGSPLLLATTAAAADAGYVIPKSLRFNSDDSAYLTKNFSTAGNQQTWTWSAWIKRTKFGTNARLFDAYTSQIDTGYTLMGFNTFDQLFITGWNTVWKVTSQVFRDPSAFFHLVVAFDVTESTGSDRIKFYVNGTQITDFSTNASPAQNTNHAVNGAYEHSIGLYSPGASQYFDGLMADIQFVDGQALAPTDFGETRSSDGVWVPKEYEGTYGTNGFHLNFSDSSTNEALGFDSAPTIPDPDPKKGMDVITYTGTGAVQNIGGLGFEPGLVWIKSRTSTNGHNIYDTVRGANKYLSSHLTNAQGTSTNELNTFNPDGFNLGSAAGVNGSGNNYVAWTWRAGGPAVSNSDGTINSQVSASTDYGFSICKFTGTGSAATVGHGLTNQTPKFILVKDTDGSSVNWRVYHASTGNGKALFLSANEAPGTSTTYWNDTSPTTSLFSVGTDTGVNANGNEIIAYVWSEVSGYSKISSYTGNGSSTGPVITTGFKVRWLLVKRTDSGTTDNWALYDSERDSVNPNVARLFPNLTNAESTHSGNAVDFLDDGFQPKSTSDGTNASGGNYVYIAFADRPGNNWDVNNIVTNEGLTTSKTQFDVVTYTGDGSSSRSIDSLALDLAVM
jgi:hypothetical protein